jgi:MarR family transcriptional regulator, organic hydroperoxide resistance regulator
MWSFEHSISAGVTREQVWAVWAAVEKWCEWDHAVSWAKLDTSFQAGATFVLKPNGGPKVKAVLTRCDPLVGFTDRSRLPFCTLEFDHQLVEDAKGMRITHRVSMTGLTTFLFRRIIGRNIERDMPVAMSKLIEKAIAIRSHAAGNRRWKIMLTVSRFKGPDDSPGFLLWRVSNEWQRRQRTALEPLGITHVQFVLMAGIGWHTRDGQSVTQAELGRHVHADEMMTSQIVRALEKRLFVMRTPHPNDHRARCLTLTLTGRTLLQAAIPIVEAADLAFFHQAESETSKLIGAFRKLLDRSEKQS